MANPWLSIPASEYDEHLAHPAVRQRAFLDRIFSNALSDYEPRSVALLGCATGGGLEHVDPDHTVRVTAVDVNPEYLEVTRSRFSEQLPQLELIQADLESCELDAAAYDLVHCALVLEYVDPEIVLKKAVRWLCPRGVLMVVLQLPSQEVAAVTPTGCDSLKLLAPIMTLHEPEAIRQLAGQVALVEQTSSIDRLETGKQFYVARYCHVDQMTNYQHPCADKWLDRPIARKNNP